MGIWEIREGESWAFGNLGNKREREKGGKLRVFFFSFFLLQIHLFVLSELFSSVTLSKG